MREPSLSPTSAIAGRLHARPQHPRRVAHRVLARRPHAQRRRRAGEWAPRLHAPRLLAGRAKGGPQARPAHRELARRHQRQSAERIGLHHLARTPLGGGRAGGGDGLLPHRLLAPVAGHVAGAGVGRGVSPAPDGVGQRCGALPLFRGSASLRARAYPVRAGGARTARLLGAARDGGVGARVLPRNARTGGERSVAARFGAHADARFDRAQDIRRRAGTHRQIADRSVARLAHYLPRPLLPVPGIRAPRALAVSGREGAVPSPPAPLLIARRSTGRSASRRIGRAAAHRLDDVCAPASAALESQSRRLSRFAAARHGARAVARRGHRGDGGARVGARRRPRDPVRTPPAPSPGDSCGHSCRSVDVAGRDLSAAQGDRLAGCVAADGSLARTVGAHPAGCAHLPLSQPRAARSRGR